MTLTILKDRICYFLIMELSEVAQLFESCSTYETQYLPTFKKVLGHLHSSNVLDIVNRYDDYKDTILGPATRKHVKSLIDKLTKAGKVTIPKVDMPVIVKTTIQDETSDEEDCLTNDNDDAHVQDIASKIKYLSMKCIVLQEYFDLTIPHIHHLPGEILADLVKKSVLGRVKDEAY